MALTAVYLAKNLARLLLYFFDYFSAFFCYMSFVVMCGGASSTMTQQWGLPAGIGAVILTIAVICTVVFGLDGILNALSKIGPVIIIMILLACFVPYKGLINDLYGLNGYLGFILVFFMIIYDIKTKMSKKVN